MNKLAAVLFVLVVVYTHASAAATQESIPLNIDNAVHADYGKVADVTIPANGITPGTQLAISPGGPRLAGTISSTAPVADVTLSDNYGALITYGGEITSFDYIGKKPAIRAKLTLTYKLKRQDNHAYIANNNKNIIASLSDTLYVLSIEPHSGTLKNLGKFKTKGTITALAVFANRVYLLVNQQDVAILDITDPGKIVIVGQYHLNESAKKLYATNNNCYIAASNNGLIALAINNPKSITEAGRFVTSGQVLDVNVQDNKAFIADGPSGFTLLDVTDPANIFLLGSNNKVGFVSRVDVDQYRVIVSNALSTLTLLDTSRPELPLITTSYPVDKVTINVAFKNNYVATSTASNAMVVDFTDDNPLPISDVGVNLGGSRRGFIRDNILYVADWFSGLHLYDISTPHKLTHIANYHTNGSSKGVIVQGDYAFVGDDDHGLQIINIHDPRHPAWVSQVPTPGLAYTLKVFNHTVYLADHRGGFHIIDISDITHPKILGSYDTPGKAWAVDIAGNSAFVADDTTGLLVFDISHPQEPKVIGQFNPEGYAEDIKIRGDYAFVAFFDKGFYILNIKNPSQPKEVGHIPIPGNARGIELKDDLAYIAAWEAGLQVVDIGDLAQPKIIGYYDTSGSAWGVNIKGDTAYVLDWWGGVKAVDISNPARPAKIGQYHAKGKIHQIRIKGNYAYVASGSGGVQIFDVKNPINPIWVTGVDLDGDVTDLAINNDHAFVATGDGGMAVININNPFQATWEGQMKTPGLATEIRTYQNFAFIVDSEAGLIVADINDPAKPRYLYRMKANINDLWVNGSELLIATQQNQLKSYKIDQGGRLTLIHSFKAQNKINLVRADKNLVYLCEQGTGIHLLKGQPKGFTQVGQLNLKHKIYDMKVIENRVYLTAEKFGFMVYDLNKSNRLLLKDIYSTSDEINSFTLSGDQAFFAGENIISSVKLLPKTSFRINGSKLTLTLPKEMPIGSYRVMLSKPDGEISELPTSIKVLLSKPKKPKFTMEQFKKILKNKTQGK